MDGWRDQGVNYNQEVTRTRSNSYRKPPLGGNPNWQQSVPSWEKKFCSSIGSVPWKKLVETKKFIHLYDNIIKWNDSAGKEAFQNAKNKFYANIHNLPYNNWLPDPDIYIDQIDWNDSNVDPNLILELESDSVVPNSSNENEQVVIFGSSFPPTYQSFSPYGWGDSDDDKKKDPNTSPESSWAVNDKNNSWRGWNENNETDKKEDGNGDSRNDYWGWNMYDSNNNFYGDVNNKEGGGSGRYMSRYKTSRFRKDDNNQRNHHSRRTNNVNGKKSGYSCAQVNTSSPAHRWSVKKPVS